MSHPGEDLLKRLDTKRGFVNVGIYDAASAAIAGNCPKTEGLFLSGLGLIYSRYGWPDIGMLQLSDVCEVARIVRNNHPNLFLTCDIDSGFGGIEQIRRACIDLKNLGVSAIQFEDQTQDDKRCGHFSGKVIRPLDEAVDRLEVALAAAGPMLVIARTDAPMHNGEALSRIDAFISAGAKVVLVDGIEEQDLPKIISTVGKRAHIMVNIIDGGKLQPRPAEYFFDRGVSIVNLSTILLFPGMAAMRKAMSHMVNSGWNIAAQPGMPLSDAHKIVDENYGKFAATSKEVTNTPSPEPPSKNDTEETQKKKTPDKVRFELV